MVCYTQRHITSSWVKRQWATSPIHLKEQHKYCTSLQCIVLVLCRQLTLRSRLQSKAKNGLISQLFIILAWSHCPQITLNDEKKGWNNGLQIYVNMWVSRQWRSNFYRIRKYRERSEITLLTSRRTGEKLLHLRRPSPSPSKSRFFFSP